MAIDPIELTRQLVGIASTTYHEHDAGVFLDKFLSAHGWVVERMPVDKPAAGTPGAEGRRRTLQCVCVCVRYGG